VLQGIGAALVLGCGAALTTSLYGEERRSRLLGVYTMLYMAGTALGPWLGGLLVEAWGWPAVFWFRAPVALFALLALRGLPGRARTAAREPFDALGAGLLALALLALLLALNRAGEPAALPLGLLAALALAGFVRHERRAAAPLLDLAVFRLPGFAVLNLANVLTNLAAFAVWLLVPYYLARESGLGLTQAGLVLAAGAVGAIVASPLGGWLAGRIAAARLALAGAVLVGFGLWLIGQWTAATPALWLLPGLAIQGVGIGLFQLAYVDIVTATLPRENRGVAGSLAMLTRTVGVVGAASLLGLAFQSQAAADGFLAAFRQTFQVAALLPFGMALWLALGRRPGQEPAA
jgi:MFS family permease